MKNAYTFHGTYITYQGQVIFLNDRTFLLDGGMEKSRVERYAYVYNDLREVLKAVNERGREVGGIGSESGRHREGSCGEGREGRHGEDFCGEGGEGRHGEGSCGEGGMGRSAGCGITVYIAPFVYWVDAPDGEEILRPSKGRREPYGMEIDCDCLHLIGLAENPEEVVLAGNRGQSHGAYGNYTLFYFRVRHLEVSGLTMGNYCSVDLDYPFNPALNRRRRTDVITQAQLARQSGDKLLAKDCRFVGRLNLCPICGGERCLYYRCHFESTDDALNGRAVYVECDFDFYGSRPLYDTTGSGAVFLGCLFRGRTKGDGIEGKQYFTKESGPVTVVSCEYRREIGKPEGNGEGREAGRRGAIKEAGEAKEAGESKEAGEAKEIDEPRGIRKSEEPRIGWTKYPLPQLRCYQYEMTIREGLFRRPVVVGGEAAAETVFMEGKGVLNGYRLETGQGVVYNTFNLLRGMDEWDPMGVKEIVLRAGMDRIPTLLTVEAFGQDCGFGQECDFDGTLGNGFDTGGGLGRECDYDGALGQGCDCAGILDQDCDLGAAAGQRLISGEPGIMLRAQAFYYYGERAENVKVFYKTHEEDGAYVRLTDYGDGTCLVEGNNAGKTKRRVLIYAVTPEGLEAAAELTVWPRIQAAPKLQDMPRIVQENRGRCRLFYGLKLGDYEDRSCIFWYRCKDAEGKNPMLTAVSRGGLPMREYPLTSGDEGYYLMARMTPSHTCSRQGKVVEAISGRRIVKEDIWEKISEDGRRVIIDTDFSNMPVVLQEKILPGFWTVDAARPMDAAEAAGWNEQDGGAKTPWKYGRTGNGSIGCGLYQNVQGARLRYTPSAGEYGDMTLRMRADPAKTAGQGFGSAGQYMDVCIKFDTAALSGYGVRIIRTKEASDGVKFILIQYEHGTVRYLSEGVMASCYRTDCEITLQVKSNQLTAHGESKPVRNESKAAGGEPGTAHEKSETARVYAGGRPYADVVDLSAEIEENLYGGIAIWHTGTPGTGGWQNTTMLHYLEVSAQTL